MSIIHQHIGNMNWKEVTQLIKEQQEENPKLHLNTDEVEVLMYQLTVRFYKAFSKNELISWEEFKHACN